MRKLVLTCLASGFFMLPGYAQTLFTYGPNSVSKDDFLRVYKKNSINKKPDLSDTALHSYMELYSLFKMKVAEADKQQLDTLVSIQRELDNYRKQLSKNYLTDEEITNKLIREAYDRMKQNVRVEHILISAIPGADTVAAYRKIDSIYHEIESKKVDFETMARTYSEDKGSKDNGGDVGYFTAMQTVYPFENAAYNTPVGKVSKPFRTQFGYHIIKVLDRRADKGQVKVAQVMVQVYKSKGEEGDKAAHMRADSVLAMAKKGVPFYKLVEQYSDDKYSVNDSGVLKTFGAGRMVPAFENAAFSMKKPGEIYPEVVKTDFGYHIIKLLGKYPLQPYDSVYPSLKRKVENDARAQTARESFFAKIKEKNGFKEYPANIDEVVNAITAIPDTGKSGRMLRAEDFKTMVKPVFTLAGKNYLQADFVKFLEGLTRGRITGPKQTVIRDAYGVYVSNVVNDFEEHKLVEENPDFKHLMDEYRDGIMLFELMDRNVWSKAAKDSAGLKAFYEARKGKYTWEPGFEGAVYKFKNKAMYDTGMTMIQQGKYTDEQIAKTLNVQPHPDAVSIQRGRYEFSRFKDATMAELQQSKIKTIPQENGQYTVVVAKEVHSTPGVKTLDEARGYVVAEYQDYLEKQWNERMRKEYPVKVDDKVFKSMVKK
jgi:peptidyl-prolyl cis-trans isomerase SurA